MQNVAYTPRSRSLPSLVFEHLVLRPLASCRDSKLTPGIAVDLRMRIRSKGGFDTVQENPMWYVSRVSEITQAL